MLPRQPPLRVPHSMILLDMIMVRRKYEGAVPLQPHHQDAQPRRVPRRVEERHALEEVDLLVGEGLPVELVEVEVVGEVEGRVGAGGGGLAGVLELFLVDVDCAGSVAALRGEGRRRLGAGLASA